MKKRKIILITTLLMLFLFGGALSVWGADEEWYELHEIDEEEEDRLILQENLEITPYSRYILGAQAIMRRPSTSVLWMRSEVYCTSKKIGK